MGKPRKSGFIPKSLPDRGNVLSRLRAQGKEPLSLPQLEAEFQVPREKSREFRKILANMIDEGQIRKVKGNKFIADAPNGGSRKIARSSQRETFEQSPRQDLGQADLPSIEDTGPAQTPGETGTFSAADEAQAGMPLRIKSNPFPRSASKPEPRSAGDRTPRGERKHGRDRNRDRGPDRDKGRGKFGKDRGKDRDRDRSHDRGYAQKGFSDTAGGDANLVKGKLTKQGGFHFVQPSPRPGEKKSWGMSEGMILVPRKALGGARPGDIVSVRIVEEDGEERIGKIIATLSQDIAFEDVSRAFSREFGIPFGYPKDAMQEAGEFPEPVFEAYPNRRDLRATYIITIDPSTAKDHDDAISLERKANGNWILGVHIADVAEYVTEASALDEESLNRAFTQYLPWTAAPMLPQRLSSDLCSLLEGRERLAFSCIMEVDSKGEVKKFDFVETFIKVAHFYSYEEAQAAKEAGDPFLTLMDEFTAQLMARRRRDGFIDFQFPEPKVELENGVPVRIFPNKRLPSHSWIEECMLLANRATARFLMKHKLPGLFRVHEQPDIDAVSDLWASQGQVQKDKGMIDAFKDISETGGFLNPAIQQFFIRLLSQEGGALPVSVQRKILQSMKKAQYSSDAHGHFALGWLDYAHFTSPIRRYADLWTHRMIKAHVRGEKLSKGLKVLAEDVAQRVSEREISIMKVERKGMKTATAWVLRNFVGDSFTGEISGLENFGIFVSLTEPYGEGLIPVRRLRDDFYEKDENTGFLVGKRTRKTFHLGDKIRVRLERSDPFTAQVDFDYLGEPE
jgi:ribonuclease R